jgi:hypothetical protein
MEKRKQNVFIKFLFPLIIILLFGLSLNANAYAFPNDAITLFFTVPLNSNVSVLNPTSTITILSAYVRMHGALPPTSQGYVKCGSVGFVSTGYGDNNNTDLVNFTYKCNQAIVAYNSSSNYGVWGYIVYVPYNLSTVVGTPITIASSTTNMSTDNLTVIFGIAFFFLVFLGMLYIFRYDKNKSQ